MLLPAQVLWFAVVVVSLVLDQSQSDRELNATNPFVTQSRLYGTGTTHYILLLVDFFAMALKISWYYARRDEGFFLRTNS